MRLVALKRLRYPRGPDGIEYKAGDEFAVISQRDADALTLVGAAKIPSNQTAYDLPAAANARHPLDHDGNGQPGGSAPADQRGDEIEALRAEYETKSGEKADQRWGIPRLKNKINSLGGTYERRDMRATD